MQSAAAKSAAPGFQSFVQFLVSLGVEKCAAIAVAENNDDHARLLVSLYSFVKGAPREELCDRISGYLSLPQALEGALLELTKEILEDYFLVAHATISFGMGSPSVQQFRRKMLQYASKYCGNLQTVALDDFVLQCSVTVYGLLDTKGTSAGVMGVFPEVLREHILGAIPKAPALLEHLLAEVEAARAAAQIAAPSRKRVRVPEVLEEPDAAALRCDENIADLDRECCSTDSADDTTVSAKEASGDKTPPPKKISKLELFRLQCAPLKMPRQRQD
jgi:hypothetical protein